MEFTFDVSQTPLIGRRILLKSETDSSQTLNRNNGQNIHLAYNVSGTPNSPRRSASLSPADTGPLTGWKRPWMSQSRVRECLVNLLTTCGQRVGLPKSPSVSACKNNNISRMNIFHIKTIYYCAVCVWTVSRLTFLLWITIDCFFVVVFFFLLLIYIDCCILFYFWTQFILKC